MDQADPVCFAFLPFPDFHRHRASSGRRMYQHAHIGGSWVHCSCCHIRLCVRSCWLACGKIAVNSSKVGSSRRTFDSVDSSLFVGSDHLFPIVGVWTSQVQPSHWWHRDLSWNGASDGDHHCRLASGGTRCG